MLSSLKGKFIEATSNFTNHTTCNENACVIYRDDWVRILVEPRENENTNNIEVEVFVSNSETCDDQSTSDVIDRLADYIRYLQNLRDHGFSLSVIGSGCILCASKMIQSTPNDNLFRALLPP